MWNPDEVTLLELLKHAAENDRAFHWIEGRGSSLTEPRAHIRLNGADLDLLIRLLEADHAASRHT